MAAITIRTPSLAGGTVGFAAASAGGDYIENDGNVIILVRNNGAVSRTVSQAPVNPPAYGTVYTTLATTVAAGAVMALGPYPPAQHNDSNARVNFTYSSEADLEVAAVRLA